MTIAGWPVVAELAARGDLKSYRVARGGVGGILQIAAAGSAAATELAAARFEDVRDRGIDAFGNPYVVVGSEPRLASAPRRMSRQAILTLATLAGIAALIGGVAFVIWLAKPRPRTLRDFEVIAVGSLHPRIHCLHRAGACDAAWVDADHVDRTEVTNAQWAACVAAKACAPHHPRGDDALPVTNVTFTEAREYCAWRGGDLPTADTWEAIARGHDARRYPWGDAPPTCARANTAGCAEGPAAATRPDGASVGGVEDLAGNVAEYVRARFSDDKPPYTVRGGSYQDDAAHATALAVRKITDAQPDVGFRCAYHAFEAGPAAEAWAPADLVQPRIDAASAAWAPWAKVTLTATVKHESRGDHDYGAALTRQLRDGGIEVVATGGDAQVTLACTEQPHGMYSYTPGATYGGVSGTAIACDAKITGEAGTAKLVLGGDSGSGGTSLYQAAIDDLERSPGWRALGAVIGAVTGRDDASAELARIAASSDNSEGARAELAKLALRHRDQLPPGALANALVASGDVVGAARLGAVADGALAGWASQRDGRAHTEELALARQLIEAGPAGERAVALRLRAVHGRRYADPRAVRSWLELLAEVGRGPELLDSARQWEHSLDPSLAAAAQTAIAALTARGAR